MQAKWGAVRSLCQAAALDNGLMLTPQMGYNTWNAFHDAINETLVLDAIDRMVSLGLVAAGYDTFTLDGGCPCQHRSPTHVSAPAAAPSGRKAPSLMPQMAGARSSATATATS